MLTLFNRDLGRSKNLSEIQVVLFSRVGHKKENVCIESVKCLIMNISAFSSFF